MNGRFWLIMGVLPGFTILAIFLAYIPSPGKPKEEQIRISRPQFLIDRSEIVCFKGVQYIAIADDSGWDFERFEDQGGKAYTC